MCWAPGRGRAGVDELVLPQADHAVHAARREPLGVEAEVADDVAGEPDRRRPGRRSRTGAGTRAGRRWRAGCARTPSGTCCTHIVRATGPTSAATRSRISSAALLVNVIARIRDGCTPSWMRWAMRWVSTLVLPDPAPATTSSGPPRWTTASSWSGLRPSVKASAGAGLASGASGMALPILRRGCAPDRELADHSVADSLGRRSASPRLCHRHVVDDLSGDTDRLRPTPRPEAGLSG